MYALRNDRPIAINEVRRIKGHVYASADLGNAVLVRVARQDYPEAGIARGDVYAEWLVNGSRESGARYAVADAVAEGLMFVDEPLFDYHPERGFLPAEVK